MRDNVLATDKVLYRGHAVAGVAATSLHIAEEALGLIDVEYEVLPSYTKVLDAMKKDAVLLNEDLTTEEFGDNTGTKSNIASHNQDKLGDISKGFDEAEFVAEYEVNTATVHQGYIEPHNGTASWSLDGNLTIWTSTQGSFTARGQLGAVLDVPVQKVKVVPQEIGGGFGGKIPISLEPVAALLSRKTGHPVKIIMTRADCFEGTGPTPGSYVRVKMGADKNGKLTAAEAYIAFEAGGFPGSPVFAAAM